MVHLDIFLHSFFVVCHAVHIDLSIECHSDITLNGMPLLSLLRGENVAKCFIYLHLALNKRYDVYFGYL